MVNKGILSDYSSYKEAYDSSSKLHSVVAKILPKLGNMVTKVSPKISKLPLTKEANVFSFIA